MTATITPRPRIKGGFYLFARWPIQTRPGIAVVPFSLYGSAWSRAKRAGKSAGAGAVLQWLQTRVRWLRPLERAEERNRPGESRVARRAREYDSRIRAELHEQPGDLSGWRAPERMSVVILVTQEDLLGFDETQKEAMREPLGDDPIADARKDAVRYARMAEAEEDFERRRMMSRISLRATRFVETNGADCSLEGDHDR